MSHVLLQHLFDSLYPRGFTSLHPCCGVGCFRLAVSSAVLHAACQQLELRVCVFVQVILCLWF